jgi:hypothetical protein
MAGSARHYDDGRQIAEESSSRSSLAAQDADQHYDGRCKRDMAAAQVCRNGRGWRIAESTLTNARCPRSFDFIVQLEREAKLRAMAEGEQVSSRALAR